MGAVRGRWRRRALLVVLCGLVITAWLGARGLAAQRQLDSAHSSLTSAKEALLDQRLDQARTSVQRAERHTARARALTSDPVWRAAAAIPYAGATFKTVRAITTGADELVREAFPAALATAEQLDPASLRRPDGSVVVERIDAASPRLRRTAEAVQAVQARLDPVEAPVAPPVEAARQQLVAQVQDLANGLQSADRTLALARPLLGADRPRRYFILVQQTAESRGTGGLPGGFAVLEANNGRVRLVDQGSNADLENGRIPVPAGVGDDYVQMYEHNGAFELWQNVNLSADLPTVAKIVAARWRHQGGVPLDGVITLDGAALAAILGGAEPLEIGDAVVPPQQLEHYLAVEQYRAFPADADQDARKDSLAAVAATAAQQLTTGGGDTEALLRGVTEAVRSGHLRMASDDPVLKPLLADAGVDGALPDAAGPVAYPVIYNASGGKLDHFLDRSISYTAIGCRGDRRVSTIRVSLTNRAPASGLPPYTLIRDVGGQLTQSTTSAVVLQVYVTAGSILTAATLDGQEISTVPAGDRPFLTLGKEGGLPVWSVFLELPREQSRSLELELDEPTISGAPRVPEQPLSRPLVRTVDVPECG